MKNYNRILGTLLVSVILVNPLSTYALTKSETVFTNMDETGEISKVIVNNHLSNLEKDSVIDNSKLTNITNINGEEEYKIEGNKITWTSTGNDIFYRGTTEEKSPIEITVKYYLDDKEVKASDIIGKSGNIKIEYKFKNNMYVSSKKLHVPFVVSLTSIIDNENNSNIKVINGKVVSTGNKSTVEGVAAPGLYQDLKINELNNTDKIVISYQTKSFSQKEVYIVATPKLLEEADLDLFNKLDEMSESTSLLQSSMNKLINGAKKLAEGNSKLREALKEIKTAINSTIAKTESDNSGALDINTINQIKSLAQAKTTLTSEQLNAIKQNTLNGLKNNDTYKEIINNKTTLESMGINETLLNTCKTNPSVTECTTYKDQLAKYEQLITMKNLMEQTAVNTALKTAQETVASTTSKIIDTIVPEVANKVKEGAKEQTVASLKILSENIAKIESGASELEKGSIELTNGLNTFDKEGIQKLSEYVNTYNNYGSKIKELTNLSKNYKGFTSNNSDETIFIYKLSSVK